MSEMGTSETESVESFRERAARWVRENLEPLTRYEGLEAENEDQLKMVAEARSLQRRIFEAGFAGIRYPREYGGLGLSHEHQLAWREAATGYRVPHAFTATHGIMGPTLLEFASEEQKRRHLPVMLKGEELWVQFLSEPSGGSDLAGLLTRAERDGGNFRLTGSKIWSTGAHYADYAVVLARTNIDVPKHQGLSMFMMPVHSPGVTINPIRLVTGWLALLRGVLRPGHTDRAEPDRCRERRLAGCDAAAVPRAEHNQRQQPERPSASGPRLEKE